MIITSDKSLMLKIRSAGIEPCETPAEIFAHLEC